jgi:hypothetical protein
VMVPAPASRRAHGPSGLPPCSGSRLFSGATSERSSSPSLGATARSTPSRRAARWRSCVPTLSPPAVPCFLESCHWRSRRTLRDAVSQITTRMPGTSPGRRRRPSTPFARQARGCRPQARRVWAYKNVCPREREGAPGEPTHQCRSSSSVTKRESGASLNSFCNHPCSPRCCHLPGCFGKYRSCSECIVKGRYVET